MDRREGMVHSVGHKGVEGTTLHRLPTYKVLRTVKFTNALLAMLVILLLANCLRMTTD